MNDNITFESYLSLPGLGLVIEVVCYLVVILIVICSHADKSHSLLFRLLNHYLKLLVFDILDGNLSTLLSVVLLLFNHLAYFIYFILILDTV